MLIKTLFSILFPILMMAFIFSGRARRDSLFLVTGLLAAFAAAYVNKFLVQFPVSDRFYIANIGPVVEEILKALPILIYAFVKKPPQKDLLEAGLSTGVGFAIIENAYYVAAYPDKVSILAALFRGIGAGMMHGLTTMAVGFGISFIILKRKLFFTGTLTFMSIAITYHAIYNMLVQSHYQLYGFMLPIPTFAVFVLIYLRREKNKLPN